MPKRKNRDTKPLSDLTVEFVAPSELRPNDYNPNRQTQEEFTMLVSSMTEDGFTTPIIATKDGVIVDGEHRWRAAQELGYEKVPVVRVDMTEAQRRIATMRHNRARGQDDVSEVANLMKGLEAMGALEWAQDALQLSDEEMRRLVDMADTVAEDLSRGVEDFSAAWEVADRAEYHPPDKPGESVSYSRPITPRKSTGNVPAGPAESSTGDSRDIETQEYEPMTRRQYVVTVSEAEVIDRVLGEHAASRLYELCLEANRNGW
jgi:ParB/RepB/Spo0J family partition protein